jgi:hypothetical protein
VQVCSEEDGQEARQHVRAAWLGRLGPAPRRSGRARGGGAADAVCTPEQACTAVHAMQVFRTTTITSSHL